MRFTLFSFLFASLVSLILLDPAVAQVDQKASVVNLQGQTVEVPYVSFDVFQAVHLRRGEDTVPLHELLTASSAEEIIAALGTADSMHTITGDEGVLQVEMYFDGAKIRYNETESGARGVSLVEVMSSQWSFDIEGLEVSPDMPVGRLSQVMRGHIRKEKSINPSEDVHVSFVYVAKPNRSAPTEERDFIGGKFFNFAFQADMSTQRVQRISFNRVTPTVGAEVLKR